MSEKPPLRVANCSGFYGDRISAAEEMVSGGPIDVLTGDWLAELTMGLLARQARRDPKSGFPITFGMQMRQVLGTCLDRGIRVVANAGGVNVDACAAAVEELARSMDRTVRVVRVLGDDVTELFAKRRAGGWDAPHLDTGEPLSTLGAEPELVHAYLGCWGIVEALESGADVVVTGRVSDAALVVGPAAWHFGWRRRDWDRMAGATVAGHVLECGAQATGGNFSFFTELTGMERAGFPLAEIHSDGSAVITKHPGTGGAVTVETVTAQLLYESDGPRYLTPDVVARFDTVACEPDGEDRVRLSGTLGEPAPDSVKVGALVPYGWRNSMTFVLTGTDIEAKAELAERALWEIVGKDAFDEVSVRLLRADKPDPERYDEAMALLRVAVRGRNELAVRRLFPSAVVQTGLASYPGLYCTDPPGKGSEVTVFWPTLLPANDLAQLVVVDGRWTTVPGAPSDVRSDAPPAASPHPEPSTGTPSAEPGDTRRVPLGRLVGARTGDKAGNATVGLWARDDDTYAWLRPWLTEDRWRALLPEADGCELRRWELPNLRAVGATVVGYLGYGVGANLRSDSQAKGLGEYLRAKLVDVPTHLLDRTPPEESP